MNDGFGRKINYIRISVTDRCNLRCVYCMPESGVDMVPHSMILTFDEITRLCGIFASLGVEKVKITGGEPLCRLGVADLVGDIKAIPGIKQVTMTTNAVELDKYLLPLYEAGLDAMNISLDTTDRKLYEKLTRRDKFDKVMENLRMADDFGKIPLKINCVPMSRDQKLWDIAEIARDHNIHVRFIEMMPIGMGKEFPFLSRDEIIQMLESRYGKMTPSAEKVGNGPAEYFAIDGFKGKIGFISAVSHKFCSTCNRVRLSATGYLKTCLQYDTGADLREPLRSGMDDEEIREIIIQAIKNKPVSHHFEEQDESNDETGIMSQIGG